MNYLNSILFCCLLLTLFKGTNVQAQKWDLKNCNPDTIQYPYNNGRGTQKFPEGSCPPPNDIAIKCFNNSKIKPVKAESQSHETYYTHTPDYAIDNYLNTRWSAGDYIDEQRHRYGNFFERRPRRHHNHWQCLSSSWCSQFGRRQRGRKHHHVRQRGYLRQYRRKQRQH